MHNFNAHFIFAFAAQRQHLGHLAQSLLIFMLMILIFQYPLSPSFLNTPMILNYLTPYLLFCMAFFVCCLPLNTLFAEDLRDGTLEQFWVMQQSFQAYILAHLCVYVVLYLLPLSCLLGGVALLFGLSVEIIVALMLSFVFSSTILLWWGCLAATLNFGNGSRSLLTLIIILPLGVPSLLVSQATIQTAIDMESIQSYVWIHSGLWLMSFAICFALCPFVLKQVMDGR